MGKGSNQAFHILNFVAKLSNPSEWWDIADFTLCSLDLWGFVTSSWKFLGQAGFNPPQSCLGLQQQKNVNSKNGWSCEINQGGPWLGCFLDNLMQFRMNCVPGITDLEKFGLGPPHLTSENSIWAAGCIQSPTHGMVWKWTLNELFVFSSNSLPMIRNINQITLLRASSNLTLKVSWDGNFSG